MNRKEQIKYLMKHYPHSFEFFNSFIDKNLQNLVDKIKNSVDKKKFKQ